jgi:hypothetical protein
MAEFQQTREGLLQSREESEKARLDLFTSGQRLRLLEKERSALERRKGDNNEEYLSRRHELDSQIAAEKAEQAKHRERFAGVQDRLREVEKAFEFFRDPRRELESHFSNQTPFLLFPLRIETRFKTVDDKPQLWVRVYPDECLVDSFEPLLSKKEVNNAARFWAEYYSSGKPTDPANPDPAVVELQKAAWRLLVSAHGDGRAAWITRQLAPEEATSNFPMRGPKTIILAIATDHWNPSEQLLITGLFKKLWLANGKDKLIQQIKADFDSANPTLKADRIIDDYKPVNFDEKLPAGLKREDADLQFAIVVFADLEKKSSKEHGWSQPTRVNQMPERLALIRFKNNTAMDPIFGRPIPFPLHTSPDPSPDADAQFKQTAEGDLEFAESIRWVADFDRAVEIGMGFRVELEQDEQAGFQRLFVLGVRLGADASEGKKQLEELVDHHYFSKKGFSILPQGTPTNNTESSDSGYTSSDCADQTFELYFKQVPAFADTDDWTQKSDGQWLAEWLGLDNGVFKKVLHSNGRDQSDSRNMNIALWPATVGYVMESLMKGGFAPETLERTRDFFNSFVSGRGPVPAVRIGNQPYGILPTAAFRRMEWMNSDKRVLFAGNVANFSFLRNLYQLLLKIDSYWTANLLGSVAHVSQQSADPYKLLLDIIGLHPNSVEFHRRYLESLIEMSNAMSLIKPGFKDHAGVVTQAVQLLHETLGYPSDILPQIAALLGLPWQSPVQHLIDDSPISETKTIRDYTSDQNNYIAALIAQARKSENALRTGEGLTERPNAELYRLLKYALELGYHTSAVGAAATTNAFNEQRLASMQVEQPFTHQQWDGETTESRYALLYQTVPAISSTRTVSEVVRDSLLTAVVPAFSLYLSSQLTALERLKDASTARLERALVEHLDCCSYRLDSWKTAILTNELAFMRGNLPGSDAQQRQTGLFLGAFGWLENVKPEKNKVISEKQIPADLVQNFNPKGSKVFLTDSANEGYIHAPSLNQGVTAAVLRNGYISHGKPDGNNVLAVNLSSERIRLALSVIEGIQGGQSLAALLGYQFERTLHDRKDLTFKSVDSYIYAMRKVFPLNADQLKATKVQNTTDPSIDPVTVPITAVEARNVVHGLNLAKHVRKQTNPLNKVYPFGLNLPHTDTDVTRAITDAVNRIIDIADAVADLGVAESVHQIVMGNYDRAAGVLETYSKGNYPQEPDVIRTPRSGPTLTHRVAVPLKYVAQAPGNGPRKMAEPSVDQWLSGILPGLDKIVCQCSYVSRADNLLKKTEISLQDIGLEPIDLLYTLNVFDTHALNELDDRFLYHINSKNDPRLDANIKINYIEEPVDTAKLSLFQVMPLIKSLRAVLIESSALTPGDVALPNEASKKDIPPPELSSKRVQDLLTGLKKVISDAALAAGVLGYLRSLPKLGEATEPEITAILQKADTTMIAFAGLLLDLGRYGITQTGIGSLYDQRERWFVSLKDKARKFVDRWQQNSDDYDTLAADPAPSIETLQRMERLIAISLTPVDIITLPIVQAKKLAFDTEFGKLKTVVTTNHATLIDLITDIQAVDTAPYDILSFDLSAELRQVPLLIYDLQARAAALSEELEKKRIPAVETVLAGLGTLSLSDQAIQVEAAVRIILGDQFKMVPRYALSPNAQAEIGNSWNATNDLLDYLKTTEKRTNPQEDWLHGISRVHEKMKHLENCLLLREAFSLSENDLTIHPVQLPFKPEKYHWMALPFPEADVNLEEGNTLLYTAFTAEVTTAPVEICGLLVDEWTELIPAKEETTGITFHYDRPNSEAPQTMLLVAPTKLTGNWQWDDLVDALSYTLEAAKARAIEPGQIDRTPFATFLPAVIGAESLHPFTIVLDNKAHYLTEETVKNIK